MHESSRSGLAQRQIPGFAEAALQRAGVIGVIPTPLGEVARAADITEIIDMSCLPGDVAARKPAALKASCRPRGKRPGRRVRPGCLPHGRQLGLLIAAGAGQPFGDIASRAMSAADVADRRSWSPTPAAKE